MLRSLSSPASAWSTTLKSSRSTAVERLANGRHRQLDLARAQVGHGRHGGDLELLLRQPLDVLEAATLAWLGQRDRHALAPGTPDAPDAVDVALGRRRHVVVDDVGERVDVETASGDVGGDEQFGGAVTQAGHHPVALRLVHAAVERLGAVAAAVHRLGELVDLGAGAAEHERRLGRLDVEDAAERRGLVGSLHDVDGLAHERLRSRARRRRGRS